MPCGQRYKIREIKISPRNSGILHVKNMISNIGLMGLFLENNLNQDIKVHGCHVDGLRYGNQSPINNFSENGVNSAYSVCEKIHLRALDETIWISLIIMYIMKERGIFSFSLLDGTAISGKLHGSWYTVPANGEPHGKTMDLKSAYKQWVIALCEIPSHPGIEEAWFKSDLWFRVSQIAIWIHIFNNICQPYSQIVPVHSIWDCNPRCKLLRWLSNCRIGWLDAEHGVYPQSSY